LIAEAAVCSQLAGDTESVNAKSQIDRLAPDRQVLELLVFHDPAPFVPQRTPFLRHPHQQPPSIMHHSPFAIRHLPSCHLPSAICHLPLAFANLPSAIYICHLAICICHLPSAICHSPATNL